MTIPSILSSVLSTVEPSATFAGSPPRIASSSHRVYYAKLGTPQEVEQYTGEAASLRVFSAISPGLAPNVLTYDVDENSGRPYMVSDYLDISGRLGESAAKVLAKRLALEVHAHSNEKGFGFDVPTYCGVTRFENPWCSTWDKAFGGMIESMLDRIKAGGGGDAELFRMGSQVLTRYLPPKYCPRIEASDSS